MSSADIQLISDKLHIRELIDKYSNICTQRLWDGFSGLFAENCAWRTRGATQRDIVGAQEVVKAIRGVVEGCQMVFQMPHAPVIEIDGDRAISSVLMNEVIKLDDASGRMMFGIYRDRLVRTPDGWKFEERVFNLVYSEPISMTGRLFG